MPQATQAQPAAEPVFQTPDEVAHKDDELLLPNTYHAALPEHTSMPFKKKLINWFRHPTKKQIIIVSAVVAVLAVGGGTAYGLMHKPKPAPVIHAAIKVTPKPAPPKPILSPLSGLPVTADQQKLPVIGVMIENSPDARPQSGLDQAGVVFEAIAEGGITRFLALYQETSPPVLGPIRSSRPYYLDWTMAFDASYAHVGGSPDALQRIKDIGVKDLDQFYNSGAYHRISTRFAPHNMYSSLDALRNLAISKGYTTSTFTPLPRKAHEQPAATPTARSINMAISGATYNTHYDYDPATNSYKRSEGGAPHIDNETKAQLSPKVVIALAMPYSLMADGYHSQYQTIGSGDMLVFQDGTVTAGTWSKGQPKEQFVFKDTAGKTLELNPGQTWITAVDSIGKVTYQP